MYVAPQIILAAKLKGVDNIYRQFTDRPGDRIRAPKVVDLLVNSTSPAAQPGARELLRRMGTAPWSVGANVHSSRKDPTRHIDVDLEKTRYHLRLDARGCVFDITFVNHAKQTVRLSGHIPFVRPGAIG